MYLSVRAFKFNVENHFSDLSKNSYNVPQGYILGPHLFSLYVNYTPLVVRFYLVLYGDDSGRLNIPTCRYSNNQLNKDFANLCKRFLDKK